MRSDRFILIIKLKKTDLCGSPRFSCFRRISRTRFSLHNGLSAIFCEDCSACCRFAGRSFSITLIRTYGSFVGRSDRPTSCSVQDCRYGTSSGCFGERSLLRESFRRKSIPSGPRVPVRAGTRRSFPETPVAGSNNFRAKSLHRPKKRITFAHRFAKFRLCGRNGGCSSVG